MFLKTVILPAATALILYLAIHFAILPLYRRHRARYAQYLPVPSTSTNPFSGLPSLQASLISFLLPSRWAEWAWRRRNARLARVVNAAAADDQDEELGEDLDFELGDELEADRQRRRRDGLSLSIDARGHRDASSDARLSRDLEEGFADDTDSEVEETLAPSHRR